MWDLFTQAFNKLFPLHPHLRLLESVSKEDFLLHFDPHYFSDVLALANYQDPTIKAAINANKFHDHEKAAWLLAGLLEKWLANQNAVNIILVPIPLSTKRERSRGYNQVRRVLEKINRDNVAVLDLLYRNRDTNPQTSLKRAERLSNMDGAFSSLSTSLSVSTAHIIIVDDVVTTGATLKTAQQVLAQTLPKDCKLTALALAH